MPSGKQARGLGRAVMYRATPFLAYLLGDCAPKAIAAKFGRENYHKRSENIGDNACGEGAVAWVDPTACPTEIQQKRTCLRIPAQSRISALAQRISQIFGKRRVNLVGGGVDLFRF